jgi:hypothetical protein
MRRVAYELEQAAESLHQRVARKARRANQRERGAIRALHRLADRAEKFNDRIGRYGSQRGKLRREYDRLHVAFEQAEHCFRELRVGKHAHRALARVSRLVYRLGDRVDSVLIAKRERRRERYEVAFQAPWAWWGARLRY